MAEEARQQVLEDAGKPALRAIRGLFANDEVMHVHRLINERVRLGIMSTLAVNEGTSFSQLRSLLNTSDGNLSVHARKLEEAGLIASVRSQPQRTEFSLTPTGRKAFESYLDHMEALIESARRTHEG